MEINVASVVALLIYLFKASIAIIVFQIVTMIMKFCVGFANTVQEMLQNLIRNLEKSSAELANLLFSILVNQKWLSHVRQPKTIVGFYATKNGCLAVGNQKWLHFVIKRLVLW